MFILFLHSCCAHTHVIHACRRDMHARKLFNTPDWGTTSVRQACNCVTEVKQLFAFFTLTLCLRRIRCTTIKLSEKDWRILWYVCWNRPKQFYYFFTSTASGGRVQWHSHHNNNNIGRDNEHKFYCIFTNFIRWKRLSHGYLHIMGCKRRKINFCYNFICAIKLLLYYDVCVLFQNQSTIDILFVSWNYLVCIF